MIRRLNEDAISQMIAAGMSVAGKSDGGE